jgi:signal peptidase II
VPALHFPPFRTRLPALLLALLALLLDQASKHLVLALHGMESGFISAPLPFFNWVLVWNRGVSFGMLNIHPEWMPLILLCLTSLMTLAMSLWMMLTPRKLTLYALALVTGGALGNILDRLQHGAVVDFLDFHWHQLHWPAFNLADSFIFIGVVFLLWDSVKESRETQA